MHANLAVRTVAALAACALLAGCATLRPAPPLPLQVTFVSGNGFVLEAAPGSPAAVAGDSRCTVRRADVQLGAIRNDTVFFAALVAHSVKRGSPRCTLEGAGIIDLLSQTDVKAESGRPSNGRTALAFVAGTLALLGAAIVLAALTGDLGWET